MEHTDSFGGIADRTPMTALEVRDTLRALQGYLRISVSAASDKHAQQARDTLEENFDRFDTALTGAEELISALQEEIISLRSDEVDAVMGAML